MNGAAGAAQRAEIEHSPVSDSTTAWLALISGDVAPEMRHSRRVALLKRLLPVIGVALLLLVAAWPKLAPLWERMRLSFPAIDLREARELRMVHPRYAGSDRLGRPFVVTAASGRQVPDRQDLMSLEAPRADMKTHSGADVVVTAARGIYQSQAQLLDLSGGVTLAHQNGTRFVTDSARVDVANNTADGSDPVVGHGPSGDVKAEGFRVLDKGDVIVLNGKSEALLRAAKAGSEKAAPAALPPPVAAHAAQVAAAAGPALAAARPQRPGRRPGAEAGATAAARHGGPAPAPAKPSSPKRP